MKLNLEYFGNDCHELQTPPPFLSGILCNIYAQYEHLNQIFHLFLIPYIQIQGTHSVEEVQVYLLDVGPKELLSWINPTTLLLKEAIITVFHELWQADVDVGVLVLFLECDLSNFHPRRYFLDWFAFRNDCMRNEFDFSVFFSEAIL